MKNVLLLAAFSLMMAGCAKNYNEDFSRVADIYPLSIDYCFKDSGIDVADTHFRVNDFFLSEMKKFGVSTIARYFDHPENPTLRSDKFITPDEAALIRSYGFNILTVFQHNNGYGRTFRNWRTRAPKDAEDAITLAKSIKQPKGSAIYFGVDSNLVHPTRFRGQCTNGQDARCNDEVVSYFEVISRETKRAGYDVGVYGSGLTCGTLKDRGLVDHCWISQSTGHWGTRERLSSGDYDIHQLMFDDRIKGRQCAGRWFNFSRRSADAEDYGQFR